MPINKWTSPTLRLSFCHLTLLGAPLFQLSSKYLFGQTWMEQIVIFMVTRPIKSCIVVRDENRMCWKKGVCLIPTRAQIPAPCPRPIPHYIKKIPTSPSLVGFFICHFFPFFCDTYITLWVLEKNSSCLTILTQLILPKVLISSM